MHQILKQQAGYWSLEVTEYQRYLTLMDGPLGKWNPTMDPLMALGMFAESDYETQRYAELYAQQEYALTEKVLRFQQAYHAAFYRLYPNARLFDQKLLEPYYTHKNRKSQLRSAKRTIQRQFKEGDRLLVFVPRACQGCGTQVHTLTTWLAGIRDARVDVYVRDVKDDQGVHDWAKVQAIDPQWLDGEALTLNRDDGLYQRLLAVSSHTEESTIQVFLQRQQQFYRLSTEDLGL